MEVKMLGKMIYKYKYYAPELMLELSTLLGVSSSYHYS